MTAKEVSLRFFKRPKLGTWISILAFYVSCESHMVLLNCTVKYMPQCVSSWSCPCGPSSRLYVHSSGSWDNCNCTLFLQIPGKASFSPDCFLWDLLPRQRLLACLASIPFRCSSRGLRLLFVSLLRWNIAIFLAIIRQGGEAVSNLQISFTV